MSTHRPVQPGDTLGLFCARHRMSREAFFALNPHKSRLLLDSGVVSTSLTEGESLRVGTAAPETFNQIFEGNDAPYRQWQACARQGNVVVNGASENSGCSTVQKDSQGRFLILQDGSRMDIAPEEEAWLLQQQRCLSAGGLPLDKDTCYQTGFEGSTFGYWSDRLISLPPVGEGEKIPEGGNGSSGKEEGLSTAAKVGIGVVALGALGGAAWMLTRKPSGDAGQPRLLQTNPLSGMDRLRESVVSEAQDVVAGKRGMTAVPRNPQARQALVDQIAQLVVRSNDPGRTATYAFEWGIQYSRELADKLHDSMRSYSRMLPYAKSDQVWRQIGSSYSDVIDNAPARRR